MMGPSSSTAWRSALPEAALGRKNFLFAGADSGGERAAAIYALIGTAKLNGLNPEAYLHHVLGRIAEHPVSRTNDLLLWSVADQRHISELVLSQKGSVKKLSHWIDDMDFASCVPVLRVRLNKGFDLNSIKPLFKTIPHSGPDLIGSSTAGSRRESVQSARAIDRPMRRL